MADASLAPNVRSAAAQMHGAERLYRDLFDRAPLPLLVLTPECRIVNANDAYLAATGRRRDTLAGLDMFAAFPDSPHDPQADGVRNLCTSFERVLRTGRRDGMPLQRYDILPEGGCWEVRYWHPANWAALDESGSVLALVHHVTDVTATVLKPRAPAATLRPEPAADDLLARADAVIRTAKRLQAQTQRDLLNTRRQVRALLGR
ncbi:PAS domain-containing protein [Methylobacterium sp. BE186]|uniref:PAS domain-containing protein n=1 Tax=Methylobacterium sp. BE186 TaxID=2817715 RepID=UPI00286644E7|nr:PAS domain-containing protein [Methylobacterium sp. BE186]MDR7038583.1 PAS domain-containing protein [Methylobacterium sp. BE186]